MSKKKMKSIWFGIVQRTTSKEFKEKNKNYAHCTISDNFKNFDYFYNWCENQSGFMISNYQLDKDLLGDEGYYSENTCCFIPRKLNTWFVDFKNYFESPDKMVYAKENVWKSIRIRKGDKNISFTTKEEAVAYCKNIISEELENWILDIREGRVFTNKHVLQKLIYMKDLF